jgi:DnaJ-class molecular chaperone
MIDSTEQKDPYKMLGVEKTASNEEIKKAYRAKGTALTD